MGDKKIVINPRIIQHLGKDLITSPDVAIVELVKNSIDAKSKLINLHLFENYSNAIVSKNLAVPIPKEFSSFIPKNKHNSKVLIVEDLGEGMSTEQLEEGFLKIGTDIKTNKENDGIVLGEKGIGRLAAQRLGSLLVVETSSASERNISFTYLDWDAIIKGKELVPYQQIEKFTVSYTRLWIFDINFEEVLEYPVQLSLEHNDEIMEINRDLRSALNFLVSPFKLNNSATAIKMYFNDKLLDTSFPHEMLEFSETTHFFSLEKNKELSIRYGLKLQPWYIERIHRALVNTENFSRLKKNHAYYKELLETNALRIEQVLFGTISQDELCRRIITFYKDVYPNLFESSNIEYCESYFNNKSLRIVEKLCEIAPISGKIYSFKQNAAIGGNIIIDSVKQQDKSDEILQKVDLKQLKQFLNNYNGIKLYRGNYRIGFLGNKESDWIKLQQYRTKGQQWFRFDLGNTVGYVSINDSRQEKIKEISSRLDISQNDVSEAFKILINIVFNRLFYELNQKANGIIKVILEENGLLGEQLKKRVKKNIDLVQQIIKKNKQIMTTIQDVSRKLEKQVEINENSASMPKATYEYVAKVFEDINEHFEEDQDVHLQAANLIAEANEQLKIIEVESYNNYKLMANGLITETITHELHSLSTTNVDNQVNEHFEFLKGYFSENKDIKIYNSHVYPIKNSYSVISNKMLQIGDMYSFLEKTFIKKGSYDEFVEQNIKELAEQVFINLMKVSKSSKINLRCDTDDLTWFVPKGVLIHVFYNLFSNSRYWIDIRRKRAEKDSLYITNGDDQIIVEALGTDGLIIYDTGTGVSPNMQDILFEPLQSGKLYNEGRGMGLYIVKKLMNSFNGDIILLDDLNQIGNRFKFLLTTAKAEAL